MNEQLGREASQFIEQALLEERPPSRTELTKVKRSLLRSAAAITVSTGTLPLAAQTLTSKIAWLGVVGKGSFVSAVVVGMSVGTAALGGGSWLVRHAQQTSAVSTTRTGTGSGMHTVTALEPSSAGVGTTYALVDAPSDPIVAVAAAAPTAVVNVPSSTDNESDVAKAPVAAARAMAAMRPSTTASRSVAVQSGDKVGSGIAAPSIATTASGIRTPLAASSPAATPVATEAVARFAPLGHASLSDELAKLEAVQRLVNRGEAAKALALLEQLKAHQGSPGLADERLALEALAACQNGQFDRGRTAEQSLLRRSPNSPMLARIHAACATEKER